MTNEKELRLKKLEDKANRTPEEEAVRVALLALKEKIRVGATREVIDAAEKAVDDAEALV